MNKTVVDFTKEQIRLGLAQLDEGHHRTFKLMYARNGGKRSVEDAVQMPIEDVLAEMPDSKLDWALSQVENSLNKKRNAGQSAC